LGNNPKTQNQNKKNEIEEGQQDANKKKDKVITIATILREFNDLRENFDKYKENVNKYHENINENEQCI